MQKITNSSEREHSKSNEHCTKIGFNPFRNTTTDKLVWLFVAKDKYIKFSQLYAQFERLIIIITNAICHIRRPQPMDHTRHNNIRPTI